MSSTRVLVVEDEVEIIDLLRERLAPEGYEVDGVTTGAQALEKIRDVIYSAVILDVDLPDTDGIALHSRIRALDNELAGRAIFMSGFEPPADDQGTELFEAHGFMPKPLDIDELLVRLSRLI